MQFDQLQQQSEWIAPPKVGDTGGASTSAPGASTTMVPGWPATFGIAPDAPWADAYFYKALSGDFSGATDFTYSFCAMFPTQANFDACQAIEWELQQNFEDHVYNMAWQADISEGVMRTFDYTEASWIATSIPAPKFLPGEWMSFVCEYRRDPVAKTLTHVSIAIDNGPVQPVGVTRAATPKMEPPYLHAAFQLDSTAAALPYSVQVKDMTVVCGDPVPAPAPTLSHYNLIFDGVAVTSVKPGAHTLSVVAVMSDGTESTKELGFTL